MSRWNTAITLQGQALLAGLDGKTFKLTSVKCSKGKATGSLDSLVALTDYVMDLSISQSYASGSTTKLRFHLSNQNVLTRFSLYQIGLYAKTFSGPVDPDPSDIGILFQVWQTEIPDVIYTASESPNGERDYVATSDVGNASTVVVNTDPAGSVPWDIYDKHTKDLDNPHKVTAAQVGASNPNSFINPDYKIWQRGTSITKDISTAGRYTYAADRHFLSNYSSTGNYATLTASQIDANTGGMHIENDGKCFGVIQSIEHNLPGTVVTLSLKIKASVAHTGYCYADGCGVQQYPVSTEYTIVTKTFILPETTGAEKIYYYTTSNSPYGTPYTLDIAWVKLELGSVATPFVPRPYADELALCQRYFYTLSSYYHTSSVIYGDNEEYFPLNLPVSMRAVPTFDFGVEGTDWAIVSRGGAAAQNGFTLNIFTDANNSFVLLRGTKTNHGLSDEATFKSLNFRVKSLDAEIY